MKIEKNDMVMVYDGSSAHKNRFREAMRMDDCGSEKTIHYEEEGTQDGAKA